MEDFLFMELAMRKRRIGNERDGYQHIQLTEAENTAKDTKETEVLLKKLMNDWERNMYQSDAEMTRYQEDLIDHLINDHNQIVDHVLEARRDKKKEMRSRKPI